MKTGIGEPDILGARNRAGAEAGVMGQTQGYRDKAVKG